MNYFIYFSKTTSYFIGVKVCFSTQGHMGYYRKHVQSIGSDDRPSTSNAPNLHLNNEPRIDGYDELFDPPVQEDFQCPICMLCLRDPVQTACGHRFCNSCMQCHMR